MSARRPDASMDLLRLIRETALEPGYGTAAASGPRRSRPVVLLIALTVIGLLLGSAFANTLRAAPAQTAERAQLIERIRQLDATQEGLRTRANDLSRENETLERALAGDTPEVAARRTQLSTQVGAASVTGPGLTVRVDDGPDAAQSGSRVLDADVRVLVNALWGAGAEAVAVNGYRLSSRTAIRQAGDAITVDYRSLTRPYVVEAIGDPRGLEDGLEKSNGRAWWRSLAQQYQIKFAVERSATLTLNADPGLGVESARPVR